VVGRASGDVFVPRILLTGADPEDSNQHYLLAELFRFLSVGK
jgi:hypothetical protein